MPRGRWSWSARKLSAAIRVGTFRYGFVSSRPAAVGFGVLLVSGRQTDVAAVVALMIAMRK